MDNNNEPAMFVYTVPDFVLKLYQFREEFYYFDSYAPNVLNPSIKAYSLLDTVQENNTFFHRAETEGEGAAIIIQLAIGFPPSTKFKSIVKVYQLQNCPIKVSDIDKSYYVYIPQVDILKGKPVRKCPGHAYKITKIPPPLPI